MSVQEHARRYDLPEALSSATSSIVITPGQEEYDPFANDRDDGHRLDTHENEQCKETIRRNNGINSHPVITKDNDRRSRSPHRKRLRLSPTVTNDSISSSSKSKSSSRNDDRRTSRSSSHRRRSLSNSPPPSSSNNHKKRSELHRSKSSRNSHSDHRTNHSSPARASSSNKTAAFQPTNNGSQRTRSNLIEIVTTELAKPAEGKPNSNQADDMLMEEMLLEEERKHDPVKPIDLDSLTIPESTTKTPIEPKQPTTPSPTKKPYYVLHKVPHTNHTTPPRQKKAVNNPPPSDDASARTSLDDRLSTLFGMPISSSSKPTETQPAAASIQALTPSDKSTESPQDIKSSILTIRKKERESIEERRSSTSKHYTTEWLATQKPEEAPTEELPSLVSLPTLTSSQPADTTKTPAASETTMLGKLSELMEKLTQKQGDSVTNPPESEDIVPISAKHLERIERRKQREERQSEIAAIAKEALKPAFRKRLISKEEYKQIMKKVVTKATPVNEIDRVRIGKMVDAYVEKYRLAREQKDSTNRT